MIMWKGIKWKGGSREKFFKKFKMTDHGDQPKLFEFDPKNNIVDVFVYRDPDCPYPFTITNTENVWYHQGFYLKEFLIILEVFLEKNNLPYKIVENNV